MKNLSLFKSEKYYYYNDLWSIRCSNKRLTISRKGMKLAVKENEAFNKIIFDADKKTVSATVANPTLPMDIPRTADLSDNVQFFNELRDNSEDVLLTGGYSSVIPNEDRTVFEVV